MRDQLTVHDGRVFVVVVTEAITTGVDISYRWVPRFIGLARHCASASVHFREPDSSPAFPRRLRAENLFNSKEIPSPPM